MLRYKGMYIVQIVQIVQIYCILYIVQIYCTYVNTNRCVIVTGLVSRNTEIQFYFWDSVAC